jgi:hypothetical protein
MRPPVQTTPVQVQVWWDKFQDTDAEPNGARKALSAAMSDARSSAPRAELAANARSSASTTMSGTGMFGVHGGELSLHAPEERRRGGGGWPSSERRRRAAAAGKEDGAGEEDGGGGGGWLLHLDGEKKKKK